MKVKDLLTDESKWCKNLPAVDKEGRQTTTRSPTACKWCLMGAIVKCYVETRPPFYESYCAARYKVLNAIREIHGNLYEEGYISLFNDGPKTTFAEIREVLERADV
jgi:hypothetical protein